MRLWVSAALAAVLVLGVAPAASAKKYWLDTYERGKDPYVGPLKTERLRKDRPYVLEVRGTFSFYSAGAQYTCGTPEKKPIYNSRRVRNGRVAADPEFIFADKREFCRNRAYPFAWTGFEIRQTRRYWELGLLGGPLLAPTPDHSYQYAIRGHGGRAKIRMRDANTRDNFGRLRLVLRRARPEECANGNHQRLGFPDEYTCSERAAGRPWPSSPPPDYSVPPAQ